MLYKQAHAKALEWVPGIEAQPLTWMLDALHGAGFMLDDPLVTLGLKRLATLQKHDGTWLDPKATVEITVETTMTALRLLHDYGRATSNIG